MHAPAMLSIISSTSKLPSIVRIWMVSIAMSVMSVRIEKRRKERIRSKQAGSKMPHGIKRKMFPKKFNAKRKTTDAGSADAASNSYTLLNGIPAKRTMLTPATISPIPCALQ